jgi:predicted nuclease with TOPRIM domain
MSDDLMKMARLVQHDERMSTNALYGDLADRIEELKAQNAILSNNLANAEHAYNNRGKRIDDLISQLSIAKIWLENAREQLHVGKKSDRINTADKIYSILQSFKVRKP